MKPSVIAIVCLTVTVGIIFYIDHQKNTPASAIAATATPVVSAPASVTATKPESQMAIAADTNLPVQTNTVTTAATEKKPADSPVHQAVDALLHAQSAAEKHELFQQLLKSGQMDQAIADLKQRMIDNPTDPEIPTTLGEAQLNEVRAIKESGSDDMNAMGILAMQADQSFNAALKIDPQNWEAQFVKNSSMYYWPANTQMDNQVVQNLSNLIDQQDTMSAQPQFAQTYVVLGNEYQKIGQPDKAQATWQLGLQKFPGDPTLQKKISGQ